MRFIAKIYRIKKLKAPLPAGGARSPADTTILSGLGVTPTFLTCGLGVPPLFLPKMSSFRRKPRKKKGAKKIENSLTKRVFFVIILDFGGGSVFFLRENQSNA